MLRRHLRFATALTSLTFIAACGSGSSPDTPATGTGGNSITGTGGNATGGSNTPKAGTGSGGTPVTGTGGTSSGGAAVPPKGGGTATGGSGATGTGGTLSGGGGNTTSTGGTSGPGGGTTGGTNTNTGGVVGGGGGGMPAGGTGPTADENGKLNATPGTMTSTPQDYLRLGEIRILNNNWGSEDLGCSAATSTMSVFVNQDKTFGWNFNRGDCDTANTNGKPDFPQIEFGIHPFGKGDERVTSPEFSSTTLLPIQIKDLKSASVTIQNLTATFQRETSWNITFELWVSQRHPVTDPNPGVHAELMTFWGWQAGRWPAPPGGMGPMGTGANDKVTSSGRSYTLWVQDDNWSNGQWRYFQFRVDDGPHKTFNGTLDVKPFIDYLVNSRQYSTDFYITRLEVGSEIDDNTQGSVSMSGITFEVNGQSRAAMVGP